MDYLKRLMKTQIKYIVFPLLLFVVIVNSSIFFGVCGSFEIVRYTGGSAREHQGFTYVHIDDDYDRISIDRFLEVKRALDGQYVHVDRLKSDDLQNQAIIGMVSSLNDRYTRYLESGYEDQISKLDGTLVGIGISVLMGPNNSTMIHRCFPRDQLTVQGYRKAILLFQLMELM